MPPCLPTHLKTRVNSHYLLFAKYVAGYENLSPPQLCFRIHETTRQHLHSGHWSQRPRASCRLLFQTIFVLSLENNNRKHCSWSIEIYIRQAKSLSITFGSDIGIWYTPKLVSSLRFSRSLSLLLQCKASLGAQSFQAVHRTIDSRQFKLPLFRGSLTADSWTSSWELHPSPLISYILSPFQVNTFNFSFSTSIEPDKCANLQKPLHTPSSC